MNAKRAYFLAKDLYRLIPLYFLRNGAALPPIHYMFEVTRACNLRCRMCQYLDFLEQIPVAKQREGELSTDEWLRVIDQVHRFCLITFTGGEAFIRKDFPGILRYASEKCRTHFISNGLLLTQSIIDDLLSISPRRLGGKGLSFIGISIDGPREIHDRIRRTKNGFDKSLDAVRALRAGRTIAGKKCPIIHITSVIQESNVDFLHELPAIVADAGGDILNLTLENQVINQIYDKPHTKPFGTYAVDELACPTLEPDRISRALERTRESARRAGVSLSLPDLPDDQIIKYYQGQVNLTQMACSSAWTTLHVSYDGKIKPSCPLLEIGNVRDSSFSACWNDLRVMQFRKDVNRGLFAHCKGCCFSHYKPRRGVEQSRVRTHQNATHSTPQKEGETA